MDKSNSITFQFISEPTDVNYGGKVHGGTVMKWIDQTGYACACNWAESYCVTVYVGGIRFYKPISIGEVIRIEASVIYTGTTSIHVSVDVFAKKVDSGEFEKKTHCLVVFVSVDETGKPRSVPKWMPETEKAKKMEQYAIRLKDLRAAIEEEMKEFL